ncbi:MAG: HAMP domain-containing histidine kinase [Lachnospiraceae bacterium]|nr:HAMP domain-containing histidine kinase [Lachnospiraceae bacterium]
METLKNKWNNMPLRRFFITTVCISIVIVAILSALIISCCTSFRRWLLPDPNAVYLTVEETNSDGVVTRGTYLLKYDEDVSSLPSLQMEDDNGPIIEKIEGLKYSVQKIQKSFDTLTPKRKLAYKIAGVTMVAAPAVLAFAGIILCSMVFYRRKLKEPLKLMADATKQIANQNLDFEISYNCSDELGDLCRSFENMRTALWENNKAMWNMLEERRLMQASVAHDLRNPIAIIEGYTEYLDEGLKSGNISMEKTAHIVQNLNVAAKRLEQYTESVRLLNQSEDTPLNRKLISALELADNITEDLSLLAEQNKITLHVQKKLPDKEINVDSTVLYRILENIINNALRYAKQKICIDFSLTDGWLNVEVSDDGDGFSHEILKREGKNLLISGQDGHMGIGLSISRLLCRKHGGGLKLSNTSNGACVKIFLLV